MPIKTKRWNDPVEPDDGFRLLICRYRPRGVPQATQPWDATCLALAPSPALHAAFYGKRGAPAISFEDYARRFMSEMEQAQYWIRSFAQLVRGGGTLTLLCSSACTDASRCHRSLVKDLIEAAAQGAAAHVHKRGD